jgi:hypothetical protein
MNNTEPNKKITPASKTPAELGDDSATVDGRQPLKVCLILSEKLVAYLDRIANQRGGQLNRSSVTRGLVSAFSQREIRFTGAREEGDIREMVGRALDHYLSSRATPAPRPAQGQTTNDRATRGGAGNGKTPLPKTIAVPAPGDHDHEAQDEANGASNFDFDRFMAERGHLPRSGYATYRPQGNTASAAGDRAKVGGAGYEERP